MSAFSAALDITAGGFTVLSFLDEVYMIYKVIFFFSPLISQMVLFFVAPLLCQVIFIVLSSNVNVTFSFFLAATQTDLAGR